MPAAQPQAGARVGNQYFAPRTSLSQRTLAALRLIKVFVFLRVSSCLSSRGNASSLLYRGKRARTGRQGIAPNQSKSVSCVVAAGENAAEVEHQGQQASKTPKSNHLRSSPPPSAWVAGLARRFLHNVLRAEISRRLCRLSGGIASAARGTHQRRGARGGARPAPRGRGPRPSPRQGRHGRGAADGRVHGARRRQVRLPRRPRQRGAAVWMRRGTTTRRTSSKRAYLDDDWDKVLRATTCDEKVKLARWSAPVDLRKDNALDAEWPWRPPASSALGPPAGHDVQHTHTRPVLHAADCSLERYCTPCPPCIIGPRCATATRTCPSTRMG